MQKDMALAHSSYARAAGIQSEVNKVTVTRVAGSEVQYQKQLNLHRKDMEIVVRNIRKEQKKLRKAIVRYSRKLHEGRRERSKREKEEWARDKNSVNNMQKVADIFKLKFAEENEFPPKENKPPDSEDITSYLKEEAGSESKVNDDDKKERAMTEKLGETPEHLREENEETTLPSISAPVPIVAKRSDDFEDDFGDDNNNRVKEARTLPEINLNSELEIRLRSTRLPSLKPRKQEVSYSDIIKLQHSTNSKKLFNLVNILAQKHPVKDNTKDPENKDITKHKEEGLSPFQYRPSWQTTDRSNVIRNEPDMTILSLRVDRHAVNHGQSELMANGHRTHTQTIQRTVEKPKQSSVQEKSPRSNFLPVLPRQPLEETSEFRKRTQKRGPISWTEAIALIKSVHTL